MPRKNTTKKRAAHRKQTIGDFVEVALPNGKKVDLYGDAADLAREPADVLRKSISVPIIGTVGDDGIRLFKEEGPAAEYIPESDDATAEREARVVTTFLNTGMPDFLMTCVLSAIDQAFDHVGVPRPDVHEDYDENNLKPLFLRTKLTRYDDLWNERERLAFAVSEIIQIKSTPRELFEAVADFVASAQGGDVRKHWTTTRVEHLLEWYEEKQEVSNATN